MDHAGGQLRRCAAPATRRGSAGRPTRRSRSCARPGSTAPTPAEQKKTAERVQKRAFEIRAVHPDRPVHPADRLPHEYLGRDRRAGHLPVERREEVDADRPAVIVYLCRPPARVATIVVMAVVALFVFSLLYLTPGDPAAIIAGDAATERRHRSASARSSASTSRSWSSSAPGSWRLAARRSRHLDLHQPAGHHADRAARRADAGADPAARWSSRSLVAVPLGVLAAARAGTLDRPRSSWRSRCSASRCRCSCSPTC